jgi:hypothetical protein
VIHLIHPENWWIREGGSARKPCSTVTSLIFIIYLIHLIHYFVEESEPFAENTYALDAGVFSLRGRAPTPLQKWWIKWIKWIMPLLIK